MKLSQRLSRLLLCDIAGWKVDISVPDFEKCIICVAPHTSNWDFIIGKLAYASVGRKAGFLMKDSWFFFPLGVFFRSIGGIAVPRRRDKNGSLVDFLVAKFKSSQKLTLAITPEGTRSLTTKWHTGFLRIAYEAEVPVVLGAIDFAKKAITIIQLFQPTGDIEEDLKRVKRYYQGFTGRYPEKFSTDTD